MKNPILRSLISGSLCSILSGIVVSIAGLVLGWKTPAQFSNGFFWAGIFFIVIGAVNAMGNIEQPYVPFSNAAIHLNNDERFKLWAADTLHGRNLLAFLGASGVLLFVMASLILLIGE